VNVALPSAQADLGFSDASRQWVITACVLAFGSLLPAGRPAWRPQGHVHRGTAGVRDCVCCRRCGPGHRHADRRPGRPGGFAAVLAPTALSLITAIFTDLKELNKAFGIFGAVSGSAGAVGLLLGGLLTDYVDWRWCMYVNIVLAVVGIIGGLTLLHNAAEPDKPRLSIVSGLI
jgi:hypothetical protein